MCPDDTLSPSGGPVAAGGVRIALTIAGSDSGGGAGIQADLKTFHQFGVFGTSVVVAITAQNTRGVTGVHAVPIDLVRAQIDAVAEDLSPAAVKSGMLATAPLVEAVARAVADHRLPNYVLDPVMVATSGDRLLDHDAEQAVGDLLVPLATLVTPNLDEVRVLVGGDVRTVDEMIDAGRTLVERGAGAVLVKGGHGTEATVSDVLVTDGAVRRFEHTRLATTSTHGTGCTLSSAITAALALGYELETAVRRALDFVHRAIASAPGLGRGHGPLNHFTPVEEETT
jgi:hydroxymethylpyrimidine/phosphomethylpyrimidine kinase